VIERTIRATLGLPLVWWRTRWIPAWYELRAGENCVARIQYYGFLQRALYAETRDSAWQLRKPNLLSRTILIENDQTGALAGDYRGGPVHGVLRLADAREYRFSRVGFVSRTLRVTTATGSELLRVQWNWLATRKVAQTVVENAGTAEPAIDLLALLAFHLLLLRRRRARS